MAQLSLATMREYLSRSVSGDINQNKLHGLLAEIRFRHYLADLGFGDRVSPGGWIARREGSGEFGHRTAVFFPEVVAFGTDYPANRPLPAPALGLHTICATFHQSGIASHFCAARVNEHDNHQSVQWHSIQLGMPVAQPYLPFPAAVAPSFRARGNPYTFLRYHSDVNVIPDDAVAEEFSKEHLMVT